MYLQAIISDQSIIIKITRYIINSGAFIIVNRA